MQTTRAKSETLKSFEFQSLVINLLVANHGHSNKERKENE